MWNLSKRSGGLGDFFFFGERLGPQDLWMFFFFFWGGRLVVKIALDLLGFAGVKNCVEFLFWGVFFCWVGSVKFSW